MLTAAKRARKRNLRPLNLALRRARLRRHLPPPRARRLTRQMAGVPQEAVADVVGVTRQAVSQWESGVRDPRGEDLRRYVHVLQRLSREHTA